MGLISSGHKEASPALGDGAPFTSTSMLTSELSESPLISILRFDCVRIRRRDSPGRSGLSSPSLLLSSRPRERSRSTEVRAGGGFAAFCSSRLIKTAGIMRWSTFIRLRSFSSTEDEED